MASNWLVTLALNITEDDECVTAEDAASKFFEWLNSTGDPVVNVRSVPLDDESGDFIEVEYSQSTGATQVLR